jgi:tryptophan-rich sensory protein
MHTKTRRLEAMSSTALSLSVRRASSAFGWARFALLALCTVVAAVAANTLFYYVGNVFVAYDAEFLPLSDVSGAVIFTVFFAICAVAVYAALIRFTRNPARIFAIVSAIVFVVTAIPDVTYVPTVPGSTNAQIAILLIMHAIAAAVIVRMLISSPRRSN